MLAGLVDWHAVSQSNACPLCQTAAVTLHRAQVLLSCGPCSVCALYLLASVLTKVHVGCKDGSLGSKKELPELAGWTGTRAHRLAVCTCNTTTQAPMPVARSTDRLAWIGVM